MSESTMDVSIVILSEKANHDSGENSLERVQVVKAASPTVLEGQKLYVLRLSNSNCRGYMNRNMLM